MSFLMASIKNGDIKKAEELIESGASVDAKIKMVIHPFITVLSIVIVKICLIS